jgi:kynurenine formamidase
MAGLKDLAADLASGAVQVLDLTAPLHSNTPILVLPEPFGQTASFKLEEISKYDDRGPAWYWNNFHTGEHTGTHLDAPNHWITGKDGDDVASIPAKRLIGPAVVLDFVKESAANPDFLLEVSHIEAWEKANGQIPAGAWVLFRTGWSKFGDDPKAFANADDKGPHTPGLPPSTAEFLATKRDILGLGVETVGIDAGGAFGMDVPFPCYNYLLGNNKYGLTQLRNLDKLPTTGAIVIAAPLKIVGGSGSPTRVLALISK